MNGIRSALSRELWIPLRAGAVRVTVRHIPLFVAWALLCVLAFQTQKEILFRVAYLIFAVLVFSFFWAAYSVATFRLERDLITPRTHVGRLAEERFLVQNTGIFTKIWIQISDEAELPMHRVSRVLNSLHAHARWSWSVRTVCRRRGRYYLGPITISSGDPFGFFTIHRRLPATTTAITVYPATIDLPTFAYAMGNLPGGDALYRRTHHTTTNVVGTREYAPGDSFNRIHWRSTARTDRLIVKEFELDPAADVWIFLDLERAVQANLWWDPSDKWDSRDLSQLWLAQQEVRLPPSTEEYNVTIGASVAKFFLRKQRAVGMVTYGNSREIIQPDRGERQMNRMLEVLSVLRGEGNTPFSHVLGVESAPLGRNITLVAVTPSVEIGWVKAAREIKRRGLRLIAVVTDPNSFGGVGETDLAIAELAASGVPAYLVREGDDLRTVLGGVG